MTPIALTLLRTNMHTEMPAPCIFTKSHTTMHADLPAPCIFTKLHTTMQTAMAYHHIPHKVAELSHPVVTKSPKK